MKRNPIPILREHFNLKVSAVSCHYREDTPLDIVHQTFNTPHLDEKIHAKMFQTTMRYWGECTDPNVRKQLWECYFPAGTRPHIYHLLCFVHSRDHMIVKQTRCTERMLDNILRQPKLKRYQLRIIGRFAMRFIEELRSKRSRAGQDPRYMTLHRALTDKARMYEHGEIITD